MHGYQIIHEIEKRSDGAWKPSPGSIYPTLQLLSDEGLVKSEEADGRRTYSLTKEGEEVANSEAESPAPWETEIDLSHNPRAQLASSGMKVAKSAAMLAQRANEEQMAKAVSILEDTARALTALIKQD